MAYREYNFDGLVGPTHDYAGLGTGNLASMASKHQVSSPKAAALEGLAKMKLLAEMGVPQAILPPQRRPHFGYLRARYSSRTAGVSPAADAEGRGRDARGTESPASAESAAIKAPVDWITDRPKIAEVAALLRAAAENGEDGRRDLAIASSASAMWAANAATVSPSPDTADGRLHITPANLVSQPHRALEAAERHRVLQHVFGDAARFKVHSPLPPELSDEGAANHTRLCDSHSASGFELFTFGRVDGEASVVDRDAGRPRFKPRQSLAASQGVIDTHELVPGYVWVNRQHDEVIQAGVFHNDVIAVGNEYVLLVHERAWSDTLRCHPGTLDMAKATHPKRIISLDAQLDWFREEAGELGFLFDLQPIRLPDSELPIADAVKSYLFNSQLVTLPDGTMALIYPAECDEVPTAKAAIERILREDNPVERAVRVDVRQSMRNGGGPACLRLRVVLSGEERAAVRGNVFWTPSLHETLVAWVNRHYRDTLTPQDLADVRLYEESMAALDELGEILELPI